MKKLVTSIAALLLFAGITSAAETSTLESIESRSAHKNLADASASAVSVRTISQIIEENAELKLKVEEMTRETENLTSLVEYSNMMHATISSLQEERMNQQEENTKSQLDYARMMNATLLHLSTLEK